LKDWSVYRVGLTGGIASGKSTVADLFAMQGVPVIDTDLIAREVVAPGTPGLEAVIAAFGRDVLQPDGTLERSLSRPPRGVCNLKPSCTRESGAAWRNSAARLAARTSCSSFRYWSNRAWPRASTGCSWSIVQKVFSGPASWSVTENRRPALTVFCQPSWTGKHVSVGPMTWWSMQEAVTN
jgi:Dephospho-CoA kinase